MSAKLSGLFGYFFDSPCRRFHTPAQLLDALREANTAAIECIMDKAEGTVRKLTRSFGLPEPLANDVLNDGIVLLIEKIRDGNYDPSKSAPQTYLVAICKNLLANHSRLKKAPASEPIEKGHEIPDDSLMEFLESKERVKLLNKLLEELGPPGSDLIRLKYLEGYRDEELLSQKLTPYTTADSLRTSRSKSMKKLAELAELAEKWKKSQDAK